MHVCVCMCMCVCARVLCNVRPYRRLCIEACMDAWIRAHAHTSSAAPSAFVCSQTLVCARRYGCKNTDIDGLLSTGVHQNAYICAYVTISTLLLHSYLFRSYMHACMHVCVYVRTRCAHRHRYVCVDRCHAHRWVRVFISPSVHLYIHIYCVCMDIHPYLDACTSERRRDARVGVRLLRPRALRLF
jgi:hypothetical protein